MNSHCSSAEQIINWQEVIRNLNWRLEVSGCWWGGASLSSCLNSIKYSSMGRWYDGREAERLVPPLSTGAPERLERREIKHPSAGHDWSLCWRDSESHMDWEAKTAWLTVCSARAETVISTVCTIGELNPFPSSHLEQNGLKSNRALLCTNTINIWQRNRGQKALRLSVSLPCGYHPLRLPICVFICTYF